MPNSLGDTQPRHLVTEPNVRVNCQSGLYDLTGEVADDADLDGTFVLRCEDTGEDLAVNGWLFHIETLQDPSA